MDLLVVVAKYRPLVRPQCTSGSIPVVARHLRNRSYVPGNAHRKAPSRGQVPPSTVRLRLVSLLALLDGLLYPPFRVCA